ncbi:hypothetical protein Q6A90_03140 [Aliarcobacter skirrowii]|uniref:STAS domain-containing protein n=1 Tax=Aliarcobacter skirrowii TaxID=28200 RepID=A0AAW9D7Q5_9BACT|nr:hypothetical protein [Aliarcobacter skirrowii]MDX4061352.1 hypothetical protein [Aliarcobacter skirrowii]MDX4068262.1 hypothetical protein [Aliarcobacter skirrowii]
MSNYFKIENNQNNSFYIKLLNSWSKDNLNEIIKELGNLNISNIQIDFKNLIDIDSICIIYLISFLKSFKY